VVVQLDLDDEGEELDDSLEDESFVPKHCLQSWEYPLSKSEKQLLYNRLCDQERAAVVRDYKRLVRRVSVSGAKPDLSDTESDCEANDEPLDEEDKKLQDKERELERQLEDVRANRRRLSISR